MLFWTDNRVQGSLTWSREIEELLDESALSNPESPSLAFLNRAD
jgi:hypothetical protein